MATLALPVRPAVRARPRALAGWLFGVAALVFIMVVVGGITRLTESGLSITRWELVSGALPPLTAADWQAAFDAYRATPQYLEVNRGMSLAEFQAIYFWEYVHRLLGRVIGLAYALPLLWFWLRGAIPQGFGPRLLGLLVLGGLQGAVGWWMVASGLVDRPEVAHERLAVHLVLALVILGALVWTALDLLADGSPARVSARPRRWVAPFVLLLGLQIVLGAFTAGLEAGYAFNTWPLMGDGLAPPGLAALDPLWRNLVNNPLTVQFAHRTLAWAVAGLALLAAWRLWRGGAGARALMLGGAVVLQFILGVLTLVHGVPLALGVAHQAGAALLVVATALAAHWSLRGPAR